jgi:acyl-CoA reductase-like NAD-dependent aldehyde dehydrogenase
MVRSLCVPVVQARGRIIHKFADLIEAHAEELAQIETLVR